MTKTQKEASEFAMRVSENGIAKMTPRQSENPTFRVYVANILGAGRYVSFWHKNSYVWMTRRGIDERLKQVS